MIMRRLFQLIPLVILAFFMACEADVSENLESNESVQDSVSSEKSKIFEAVNAELKADINNPFLYLKRAKLYMDNGELDLAIKDVNRAIKIDSLMPEYYLLKAELLKKQYKLKESKDALDACMLIDNDNIEARLELGYLALVARNYKQALDYADAVLKRDVYNAEAYYLKGMVFEEKQDTVLALSSYSTAVEQENDYYEAYIKLGILNLPINLELAKGYIENALRIEPNNLEALYAYGMCNQEIGDYNLAIETYLKIIEIQEYREPYFNLGYIHHEYLKVFDVAIDYYTKAIEVEPKYIEAYYNRALCYEELNKLKMAETDLRTALELNPQYTNAALALDRVLHK